MVLFDVWFLPGKPANATKSLLHQRFYRQLYHVPNDGGRALFTNKIIGERTIFCHFRP